MRISFKLRGEEELLRRLTSLGEMPGLDLALDQAAERSLASAKSQLTMAGEIGVADSLTVENGTAGSRRITTAHPRAWFTENGTRRRPALRWLERSVRAGGDFLRQAFVRDVARPNRRTGKERQ